MLLIELVYFGNYDSQIPFLFRLDVYQFSAESMHFSRFKWDRRHKFVLDLIISCDINPRQNRCSFLRSVSYGVVRTVGFCLHSAENAFDVANTVSKISKVLFITLPRCSGLMNLQVTNKPPFCWWSVNSFSMLPCFVRLEFRQVSNLISPNQKTALQNFFVTQCCDFLLFSY